MENDLIAYGPAPERPTVRWPGGARVAFYVALDYGWPEDGVRVGIWRTIRSLDRYGVRASALTSAEAVVRYPQIVEAGLDRDWAWVGHGRAAQLAEAVNAVAAATGFRPLGWLGLDPPETLRASALLAELGLRYVLDRTNDDQPYALDGSDLMSIPYTVELDDLYLFGSNGHNGPDFVRAARDQFDQLNADAAASGQVMALVLHPSVIGQPFRAGYLDQALAYLAGQPGIWLATSDEIAEFYRQTKEGSR